MEAAVAVVRGRKGHVHRRGVVLELEGARRVVDRRTVRVEASGRPVAVRHVPEVEETTLDRIVRLVPAERDRAVAVAKAVLARAGASRIDGQGNPTDVQVTARAGAPAVGVELVVRRGLASRKGHDYLQRRGEGQGADAVLALVADHAVDVSRAARGIRVNAANGTGVGENALADRVPHLLRAGLELQQVLRGLGQKVHDRLRDAGIEGRVVVGLQAVHATRGDAQFVDRVGAKGGPDGRLRVLGQVGLGIGHGISLERAQVLLIQENEEVVLAGARTLLARNGVVAVARDGLDAGAALAGAGEGAACAVAIDVGAIRRAIAIVVDVVVAGSFRGTGKNAA